jgi:hypothetical protein
MNAQQMLSLRKPDKRFDSLGRQEPNSQQQNTRFSKKNNIKDILVRNFFRKFPIGIEVSDMEQIRIEKEAAFEFEEFVIANKEINSKNLTAFEAKVAEKLRLKRILTTQSVAERNKDSFVSPTNKKQFGPLLGSNVRDKAVGMASQGRLDQRNLKRGGKSPNSF